MKDYFPQTRVGEEFRKNATPVVERFGNADTRPAASIIVLNRNGAGWLPKCFESIKKQTILPQLETILVDNDSSDDSVAVARRLLADFPSACIARNRMGFGFCGGNNVGAGVARGRFVFFINNDAWLEPDCMERLLAETVRTGAAAATPWVLNYADDTHQDLGYFGFDIFGLACGSSPAAATREIFSPTGCTYLIDREVFKQVGMFDPDFFMYSDETDLSWRVQIAGHKVVGVPSARAHHRGAAGANPAGGAQTLEFRTTEEKRFLTNRNSLLTLLKCGRHILLLLMLLQVGLLMVEGLVMLLLTRRWSFFRRVYLGAIGDCWRMRGHVREQRRVIAGFRRHGDFWMLRFLRPQLNRWFEIKRVLKFGLPRVDTRASQ